MAIVLVGWTGFACSTTYVPSPRDYLAEASDRLRTVSGAAAGKPCAAPYESVLAYATSASQSYPYFRDRLVETLDEGARNSRRLSLDLDAATGFPSIYARRLTAEVNAHQALAQCYLSEQRLDLSREHAEQSILIARRLDLAPSTQAEEQAESYALLSRIAALRGWSRRSAAAEMNEKLLEDFLQSERGVDSFYLEKMNTEGEAPRAALAEVAAFTNAISVARSDEYDTKVLLAVGAMLSATSVAASAAGSTSAAMMAGIASGTALSLASQMAVASQAFDNAEDPSGNATFLTQLVDPSSGSQFIPIMSEFLTSMAGSGGDLGALAGNLRLALPRIEIMRKADGSTYPQRIEELGAFARGVSNVVATINESER